MVQGGKGGGAVAAPIAQRILERTLAMEEGQFEQQLAWLEPAQTAEPVPVPRSGGIQRCRPLPRPMKIRKSAPQTRGSLTCRWPGPAPRLTWNPKLMRAARLPDRSRRVQRAQPVARAASAAASAKVFSNDFSARAARHPSRNPHAPPQRRPGQQQQPPRRPNPVITRSAMNSPSPLSLMIPQISHPYDRESEKNFRPRGSRKTGNKLIISVEKLERRVALLENGRLEEYSVERNSSRNIVGSVYKGRVKNIEQGLKAMFVDIGFEKNAFLHFWDAIPAALDSGIEEIDRPDKGGGRPKKKRITANDIPNIYPVGSEVIVQVTKGPIGTKGPRVTTNLSFAGRYLVFMPYSERSGISRKIEDPKERDRLRKILRELDIPEGIGVIIRTVGEGQRARYFVRDLAYLVEQWRASRAGDQGGEGALLVSSRSRISSSAPCAIS